MRLWQFRSPRHYCGWACLEMLRQATQHGVDRDEIRNPSIIASPHVVIAPIAPVDLWMMLFG